MGTTPSKPEPTPAPDTEDQDRGQTQFDLDGPVSTTDRAPPPTAPGAERADLVPPGSMASPPTMSQIELSQISTGRATLPEAAYDRSTEPGAGPLTAVPTMDVGIQQTIDHLRKTLPSAEATRPAAVPSPPSGPLSVTELPDDAPDWMVHARELSRSLEWAISSRRAPSEVLVASIERAHEAWVAGGFSCGEIAQTANLVSETYRALHLAPTKQRVNLRNEAIQKAHRELPVRVKRWVSVAFVDAVFQEVERYGDEQTAQRKGTMRLLGWDISGDRWASELIRVSVQTTR